MEGCMGACLHGWMDGYMHACMEEQGNQGRARKGHDTTIPHPGQGVPLAPWHGDKAPMSSSPNANLTPFPIPPRGSLCRAAISPAAVGTAWHPTMLPARARPDCSCPPRPPPRPAGPALPIHTSPKHPMPSFLSRLMDSRTISQASLANPRVWGFIAGHARVSRWHNPLLYSAGAGARRGGGREGGGAVG